MGNKGQNLMEYILLVAAVMIVFIYFFANRAGGPMGLSVNSTLTGMVNSINTINSEINLN